MKKIAFYFILISVVLFYYHSIANNNWQEWTWVKVPFTKTLRGVYFQDSDSGWVVGNQTTIRYTTDRGRSWIVQDYGTFQNLYDIQLLKNNTAWIAGDYLLQTRNRGREWVKTNQNGLRSIFFIDTLTGMMGGSSGVFTTIDGGNSWTLQQYNMSSFSGNSVFLVDKKNAWSVGSKGDITYTNQFDFMSPYWTKQKSNTTEDLLSVYFKNKNIGWAVGTKGTIIFTSDAGKSWNKQTSNISDDLQSISFSDSLTGWIAGKSGTLLKTTNSGQEWIKLDMGTDLNLNCIRFSDNERGWLVGDSGLIYKHNLPVYIDSAISGPFCAGDSIFFPFSVRDDYKPNNTFIAQLSDISGSFKNPSIIGTITEAKGIFPCKLSETLKEGDNYRIRILSTNPSFTSDVNEDSITIHISPQPVISGPTKVCNGNDEVYSVNNIARHIYKWTVSGGKIKGNDYNSSIMVNWDSTGKGKVRIEETVDSTGCNKIVEKEIIINPIPPKPTITRIGDTLYSSSDYGNQWFTSGTKIANATKPSYVPPKEGVYRLQMTDTTGCQSLLSASFNFLFNKWHQVNDGLADFKVNCVAYLDTRLFACTSNEGIYISDDFGMNWVLSNTGLQYSMKEDGQIQGAGEIKSVTSINNKVIAGSSNGGAYISTDMGSTWKASDSGLTNLNIWTLVPHEGKVICGTSGGGVFISTNTGDSWIKKSTGLPNAEIRSITVLGNNIYAGAWDNGIYVSTNDGDSWAEMNYNLSNLKISSLSTMGGELYAGTWGNGVYASSDSGKIWRPVNIGLSQKEVYSIINQNNNLIAGTNGGGVFISNDKGLSWQEKNEGLVQKEIRTLSIAGEFTVAGIWNGGIFRNRISLILGVNETAKQESCCLRIMPNPADKLINIFFTIPEAGKSRTRIINLYGVVVFEDESNNLDFEHEQRLSIEAGFLPGGIYFCQITGKTYSITEKFIILK